MAVARAKLQINKAALQPRWAALAMNNQSISVQLAPRSVQNSAPNPRPTFPTRKGTQLRVWPMRLSACCQNLSGIQLPDSLWAEIAQCTAWAWPSAALVLPQCCNRAAPVLPQCWSHVCTVWLAWKLTSLLQFYLVTSTLVWHQLCDLCNYL